jgi:hypothetical protein
MVGSQASDGTRLRSRWLPEEVDHGRVPSWWSVAARERARCAPGNHRRTRLGVGMAMVVALLAGTLATPAAANGPRWPSAGQVISHLGRPGFDPSVHPDPAPRLIALTFDDGPHPTRTPAILDILAARAVKATFFVTGDRARTAGSPAPLRRRTRRPHPGLAGLGHRPRRRCRRERRRVDPHRAGRTIAPLQGKGAWVDLFDWSLTYTGGNPSIGVADIDAMAAAGSHAVHPGHPVRRPRPSSSPTGWPPCSPAPTAAA